LRAARARCFNKLCINGKKQDIEAFPLFCLFTVVNDVVYNQVFWRVSSVNVVAAGQSGKTSPSS